MSKELQDIELFQGIFQSSVEGILVVGADGIIIKANPASEQLFGYKAGELIAQKVESLIPKKFKKNLESHRLEYIKKPKKRQMGQNLDLWGLRKDGSQFPLEISLSPTNIEEKKVVVAFLVDITKRLQTKQSMVIGESKIAEAQQLAHVGSWYWNSQTNETSWSDEFYRILGLQPGDQSLNTETAIEFIHPNDRENAIKIVNYAIKNKTSYNYKKRILRPDGTIRYIIAEGKVDYNSKGEPIQILGTMQDVTENKIISNSLDESNRKFSALIDNLQGVVYRYKNDKNRTMDFISKGCYEISGFKPEQFYNSQNINWGALIHPEDRDRVWNNIQKALSKKQPFQVTYRIITANNEMKWILEHGIRIPDANKKLNRLEGYMQDISELKQIEAELTCNKEQLVIYAQELEATVSERTKELTTTVQKLVASNLNLEDQILVAEEAENKALVSQQLLTNIAQNFPKGLIAIVNNDLSIDYIVGEELDLLEQKGLIVEGTTFNEIDTFSEEQKLRLKNNIIKTLKGKHLSFEIEFNEKPYLVNTTPLYSNAKKITQALLVYNNISQQKKVELKISNTLKREQELSELKSRFISMASHEFRTPLSAILTSTILIEKLNAPGKEDKRLSHVSKIRSSVKNLVVILNDFLSLSKLQEGKVVPQSESFDFIDFSKALIEEIKTVKKNGQTIILQCDHSTMDVCLDSKLLKHIVFNLLSNAIKYSAENKKIILKIDSTDEQVFLEVIDQGIGIPEEEQKSMFTRFYRANNVSNIEGTGLGLNIVKQYTELMRGDIKFESRLNIGSTFYVRFPLKNRRNEENIIN